MTINGNRNFRGIDGRRYRVENTPKKDVENGHGKYYLRVLEDGFYKNCCDIFYNVIYFNTIKDAQREVFYGADSLLTF